MDYLRILHLAASTMESEVEIALDLLLSERRVPTADQVKALASPRRPEGPVDMPVLTVDLGAYDSLLRGTAVAS